MLSPTKEATNLLFRLQRSGNDDCSQFELTGERSLGSHCRDNCTTFSFGGFNDYITHIYISFLIGHLEEKLFGNPLMLQFSSSAIFFKEHSLGQNVFKALHIFTKLSVRG